MAKRKDKIEYRYYELPTNSYILALLGQKWTKTYGLDNDTLHFHNHLEIGYCYKGQGELILEEKSYSFADDSFTIIPRNFPHNTNSSQDTVSRWEYIFIDVERFFLDMYPDDKRMRYRAMERIDNKPLLLHKDEHEKIAGLILDILNEVRYKKEFYLESLKGILLILLMEIMRLYKPSIADVRTVNRKSNLVAFALEYIGENYMNPIKMEDLARGCCISETHFRRIFGEIMHMTPSSYINLLKIHTACEMLRKTNEPIKEVAEKVGFTTLSTFNRNFKRILDTSPFEWRNHPENYERRLLDYKIAVYEGW